MDCKALNERMLDYFDGALDERTRREVEAHLESCLACREEVESLRETWARLAQLPADAPGSAGRVRFEEMLRAYESGRETPSAIPREGNLGRGLLRVAAAVALVILGAVAGYGMKSIEPPIATRTDGLTRYLLTVYEVREQTDRIPEEQMRAAGERYRAWERDLTEHGQLLDVALLRNEGAAKIRDIDGQAEITALELPADREAMTYYWLIQAKSYDEAIRIARGCPMLTLGARVELREIEDQELPST